MDFLYVGFYALYYSYIGVRFEEESEANQIIIRKPYNEKTITYCC